MIKVKKVIYIDLETGKKKQGRLIEIDKNIIIWRVR